MAGRDLTIDEQDQLIAEAVEREEPRLRSFIRKRVLDLGDAEDVLQDVFYELISAYRMRMRRWGAVSRISRTRRA
jgi:DNA-directed RNA polymerase specialized sigma24 family protein